MKYLVSNSTEMINLEEFVKSLPKSFVDNFGVISCHPSDSNFITLKIDGHYKKEINLIELDNIDIEFIYDENKIQTGVKVKGDLNNKKIFLEYERLVSPISKINFKY